MQTTYLSLQDIQRILPHRFPFLMIDRVVEVKKDPNAPNRAGQKIIAIKNVTINEPYFQGHFPDRPVMPGVMVVEMMAQAGALCCHRDEDRLKGMALCSVSKAKFRAPISPGDQLEVYVTCTKDKEHILSFYGEVHVDGNRVAESEFLAKAFLVKDEEGDGI